MIEMTDWQTELAGNFARHGVLPVPGSFGIESVRGGKYHPLRRGGCCVVGAALIGHSCRSDDKLADFARIYNRSTDYTDGLIAGFDCYVEGMIAWKINGWQNGDDDYAVGLRDGVAVRSHDGHGHGDGDDEDEE